MIFRCHGDVIFKFRSVWSITCQINNEICKVRQIVLLYRIVFDCPLREGVSSLISNNSCTNHNSLATKPLLFS